MPQIPKVAPHGFDLPAIKPRRLKHRLQSEAGETEVIMRLLMLVPALGCGQVEDSARLQHSRQLGQDRPGIRDVFQHLRVQDRIDGRRAQWQGSEVGSEVQARVVPRMVSHAEIDGDVTAPSEKSPEPGLTGSSVQDHAMSGAGSGGHEIPQGELQGVDPPLQEAGKRLKDAVVEAPHSCADAIIQLVSAQPWSTGRLLKVGLTGGIATGKSHVLRCLAELGAAVIDADRIAREIVQPGLPAHRDIVEAFGQGVLDSRGEIDRKALGALVFSNPARLRRLNAIMHPRILEAEDERIRQLESSSLPEAVRMVVVDAALMIEVGSYRKYDQLLIAYCPPATQLRRVIQRDGMTEQQARERIAAQMPLVQKLAYADYVIETSDEPAHTRAQVEFVYRDLIYRLDCGSLPVRRKA